MGEIEIVFLVRYWSASSVMRKRRRFYTLFISVQLCDNSTYANKLSKIKLITLNI